MWQTSLLVADDDDDDDALFWVIVNKVTKASWSELVEQTLQPPFDLIINTNLYIFPMIFLQICTWLHASFHWSTLEFQRQRAVGAYLYRTLSRNVAAHDIAVKKINFVISSPLLSAMQTTRWYKRDYSQINVHILSANEVLEFIMRLFFLWSLCGNFNKKQPICHLMMAFNL